MIENLSSAHTSFNSAPHVGPQVQRAETLRNDSSRKVSIVTLRYFNSDAMIVKGSSNRFDIVFLYLGKGPMGVMIIL